MDVRPTDWRCTRFSSYNWLNKNVCWKRCGNPRTLDHLVEHLECGFICSCGSVVADIRQRCSARTAGGAKCNGQVEDAQWTKAHAIQALSMGFKHSQVSYHELMAAGQHSEGRGTTSSPPATVPLNAKVPRPKIDPMDPSLGVMVKDLDPSVEQRLFRCFAAAYAEKWADMGNLFVVRVYFLTILIQHVIPRERILQALTVPLNMRIPLEWPLHELNGRPGGLQSLLYEFHNHRAMSAPPLSWYRDSMGWKLLAMVEPIKSRLQANLARMVYITQNDVEVPSAVGGTNRPEAPLPTLQQLTAGMAKVQYLPTTRT